MPATLGFAHAAHAQEPAASGQLQEIVVTSRKSSENLQKVPLAITAISTDTLVKANVRQIRDIAMLTPGLNIGGDGAERGQQPSIRGLTFSGDQNGEGNVAVMLDGIYLANSGVMSLGLMEMERVEVVKGPQSALYGHNAFGGAINYVPKAPPRDFEGKIQLRGGNYGTLSGLASIGGPLVEDKLFFRLAGTLDRADGTYKDAVNGKHLGGWEKRDVSLQLRFTPSSRATFDMGFYYGNDAFGRTMQASFDNNCFANAAGLLTQYCGKLPATKSLLPLLAPSKEPPDTTANDRKVKHARARATFDLDFATLVASAGYFDTRSRQFSDLFGVRDGIPYQLVGAPAGTVNLAGFFGGEFSNKDKEAELRLSSKADQRLRWAAGAYYYKSDQTSLVDIGIDSDPIPPGRTIVCPANFACWWLTPGGRRTDLPGLSVAAVTQKSLFSSLTYDFTSKLTLSAEARYTWEDKFNDVLNVATARGAAANPDGNGLTAKFKFFNPRFTANYQITSDNLLYVSAAKGTKSGGFNNRATLASELTFGAENNWTYELGVKNTLFDRRVRVNAAVFYIDWTDLQASVPSRNPTDVGGVTQNFGSVKAMGGELEVAASVASGVTLNGGLAYTNPKFGSDSYDFANMGLCASQPSCASRVTQTAPSPRGPVPAVSLDGLTRLGVSRWQVVMGVNINKPLMERWSWFAAANYKYESKQFSQIDDLRWQPARNTLNLSVGVENGPLRLTAWAQNALDEVQVVGAGGGGITRYNNFQQFPKINVNDRRRVGVTLDYAF